MWLLLTITLLIVVAILLLHWLNIIKLTDVFASESDLSKLVIAASDDPKISGGLMLIITVLFILSNSLTTTLLVVVSAVFSLHWMNIVTLPGFFPSAANDPKISGAITVSIIVSLTLSTSLTTTVLAAVNVVLWFLWLKIINLQVILEWNLSVLVIQLLDDRKLSGALTLTITVFFFMSNIILTTFLVSVYVIFSLHWFNIITLTRFFPSWLKNPKISGVFMVMIAVLLTVSTSLITTLSVVVNVILWSNWLKIISLTNVFTSEIKFSELIFTALHDPSISGLLTPTITVFVFMSNIVILTLSVVVLVIFSLHWFNIITLTHIFDLGLNNPKISGVLTLTVTVLLTLSNSLTITLSVAVIVTLWLNWLDIITLADIFTYARNFLELVIAALDDPKISRVVMLTVTMLFIISNSVTTNLFVVVSVIFSLLWLNIVTLPDYVPPPVKDPKVSRAVAVTIALFVILSNPLTTTLLAALNFVLWFHWLEIITLKRFFILSSDLFMSISGSGNANTSTDAKSEGKDLKSTGVEFEKIKEEIQVKLRLRLTNIWNAIRVKFTKIEIRRTVEVKVASMQLEDKKEKNE